MTAANLCREAVQYQVDLCVTEKKWNTVCKTQKNVMALNRKKNNPTMLV